MKEEDKKLLLIDLCARLPYGVRCEYEDWSARERAFYKRVGIIDTIKSDGYVNVDGDYCSEIEIEEIKPYLFPMSSMTDEQEVEFDNMECDYFDNIYGTVYSTELNWLNKNHFDYHNLIEKGLALDATKLNIY